MENDALGAAGQQPAVPPADSSASQSPASPAGATPPPSPPSPPRAKGDDDVLANPKVQEAIAAARRSAIAEAREATKAEARKDAERAKLEESERLRLEKAEADQKAAKAEADLVNERIRSTIATELLTTDVRLASASALGVVEHLVAQKVREGIDPKMAVGAVLLEHPYLKAQPAAAAVQPPAPASTPATTGVSPAASGTVSTPEAAPPPVKDVMKMPTDEWAAHRRSLGL